MKVKAAGGKGQKSSSVTTNKRRRRKHVFYDAITKEKISTEITLKSPIGGQEIEFTKEIGNNILAILENGNHLEVAVKASGISMSIFYRWLKMASVKNVQSSKNPKALEPYVQFARELSVSLAVSEVKLLDMVNTAAKGGWTPAAMWMLERRFPDRWSKRTVVHQHHGGSIEHVHDVRKGLEDPLETAKSINEFQEATEVT